MIKRFLTSLSSLFLRFRAGKTNKPFDEEAFFAQFDEPWRLQRLDVNSLPGSIPPVDGDQSETYVYVEAYRERVVLTFSRRVDGGSTGNKVKLADGHRVGVDVLTRMRTLHEAGAAMHAIANATGLRPTVAVSPEAWKIIEGCSKFKALCRFDLTYDSVLGEVKIQGLIRRAL